ncbi:urease subunit beta [Bacillus cereus BAG1X2-3]|uniref:Urease subunit beta n=3 Tax=Bacillus cereus group TaxID=86661 RepID=A0A9X5V502_BACCE|nr:MULTISPECIES: urease subunit beta [Bacillus]PAW40290.1 urease subunit beta [Bacillus toyonensis]AKR10530.1 urease subunit beta [Bacillus thuringiensis]EOO28763.1 urease subunit beta [Bacillus cereus BAG1X1-1]EOO47518.1 urease subunit beta [Bacillus cereus BAG1X2-1]EOO53618.1 urease subunit beta [Bacillus cereus BAG1X2-2]
MIPGQYILAKEDIVCNGNKKATKVKVLNQGDRPIQIGSHYHFYEVNEALKFNRSVAIGRHLNIPAGTAVRFEPGDEKTIELVPYSGEQEVYGFKNKVDGDIQSYTKRGR